MNVAETIIQNLKSLHHKLDLLCSQLTKQAADRKILKDNSWLTDKTPAVEALSLPRRTKTFYKPEFKKLIVKEINAEFNKTSSKGKTPYNVVKKVADRYKLKISTTWGWFSGRGMDNPPAAIISTDLT